jgi:hypothetical protein
MAFRIDLASTLRPAKKTPAGHLRVDAHLTRTGVFLYRNPDGSERHEYRPASEVHDPVSLASFELIPVTNDHPPVMVNAENAREYTVGATSEGVKADGDHVAARLVIMDAKAVADVEGGKVQISNGYSCDLDETPGVAPDGTHYDAVQRNIRGNHVAIVDVGRAGPTARIRMDAAVMITERAMDPEELKRKLDAMTAERDALKAKIDAFPPKKKGGDDEDDEDEDDEDEDKPKGKIPAFIKKKMDKLESQIAKLEGERDAALARVKTAEAAPRADAAVITARVKERVALEGAARSVLDAADAAKLTDMADADVMLAVVRRVDGEVAAKTCADKITADAGKGAVYLRARYDGAIERALESGAALGELRVGLEANRIDAGKIDDDLDEDKARRDMNARSFAAVENSKKGT